MLKSGSSNKLLAKNIFQIILVILIALFITIGRKVNFFGDIGGSIEVNNIDEFSGVDILVFSLSAVCICGLFYLIKRYRSKIQEMLFSKGVFKIRLLYIWLIIAGILIIAWLPYLLSFAPGSVLGDSLSSVEQVFSGHFSNHHPVLYTLLVGIFIKIGVLVGNINIGVFLYSCFQYLILASTLSVVATFLVKQGLRKIPLVLTVLFFALCPIFPSYAIIMWKDPIFSIALLLMGLYLFDLAKNGFINMSWWKYGILVLLTIAIAFFRNNGLFILLLMIPILLVLFKKPIIKVVVTITITTIIALIIQGPIYSMLRINKPSVEAFSIPLQQMAWVISQDEDKINEEDKEFLGEIMPIETWRRAYTPTLVDSIKWHPDFNTEYFSDHLSKFITVWLRYLPSNFDGYVNAYLLETVGYWHPYYQNSYGYIDQYILDNDYGIHETDLIQKGIGFSIKDQLKSFRPMIGTGFIVIVMLLSLLFSMEFHKRRYVLLYITSLLCWGVIMISTPVAFSLRYVFVIMLALPIFVLIPFSKDVVRRKGK